jgi:hypothetical protein
MQKFQRRLFYAPVSSDDNVLIESSKDSVTNNGISKWEHGGKIGANTQVDDGTGKSTTVRACVKAGKIGFNTQEGAASPATWRGELEGVRSAIRVRSRSCMPSSARSASAG